MSANKDPSLLSASSNGVEKDRSLSEFEEIPSENLVKSMVNLKLGSNICSKKSKCDEESDSISEFEINSEIEYCTHSPQNFSKSQNLSSKSESHQSAAGADTTLSQKSNTRELTSTSVNVKLNIEGSEVLNVESTKPHVICDNNVMNERELKLVKQLEDKNKQYLDMVSLFNQLQDWYNQSLTQLAEARNTIDELRFRIDSCNTTVSAPQEGNFTIVNSGIPCKEASKLFYMDVNASAYTRSPLMTPELVKTQIFGKNAGMSTTGSNMPSNYTLARSDLIDQLDRTIEKNDDLVYTNMLSDYLFNKETESDTEPSLASKLTERNFVQTLVRVSDAGFQFDPVEINNVIDVGTVSTSCVPTSTPKPSGECNDENIKCSASSPGNSSSTGFDPAIPVNTNRSVISNSSLNNRPVKFDEMDSVPFNRSLNCCESDKNAHKKEMEPVLVVNDNEIVDYDVQCSSPNCLCKHMSKKTACKKAKVRRQSLLFDSFSKNYKRNNNLTELNNSHNKERLLIRNNNKSQYSMELKDPKSSYDESWALIERFQELDRQSYYLYRTSSNMLNSYKQSL